MALAPLRASARRPRAAEATRAETRLGRMEIVTVPGGAGDVFHGLKAQAGLTQAGDGSDLFVRGGDPAETAVLADGARLLSAGSFETLHGGLFGVLNPSVVREVRFHGGGFSARYGNALSGVLDATLEGRPAKAGGGIGATLSGGNAALRLPLGRRAGGWATLRATDARLLLQMQGTADEFTRMPQSLEATVGVSAQPREGLELRAVALAEGDAAARRVEAYGWEGPFRSSGRHALLALSARAQRQDDGAWVHASLSGAERRTALAFGVLDRERTDLLLRAAVEGAHPLAGGVLRAGVEAARYAAAEDGAVPATGVLEPGAPVTELAAVHTRAGQLGGFAEGEWSPAPRLTVSAGLRADRLPGEEAWTLDPRASAAYRVGDWTLRLGGGLFHQGRWRVRYRLPDAAAPGGLPTRAAHLLAGVERGGPNGVRVEAYWKGYGRYVEDGEGPQAVDGTALGVDALARWRRGSRLNGWVSYSFLRSRIRTADGRAVPAAADVTHGLVGVAKLALGDLTELGTTARLATGRPYTPVTDAAPRPDGGWDPVYAALHGERMPAYARLDLRLTRLLPLGERFAVLFVEALNLTGRRNVAGWTYDAAWRERRPIDSFFARRVIVVGADLQVN
ncbi:MAG TPA: Plug domain-containing protein [Longimicrobiaceae bacterium]|nr:Plug domain-containing protein [Longimicrobiaceae bacterium]